MARRKSRKDFQVYVYMYMAPVSPVALAVLRMCGRTVLALMWKWPSLLGAAQSGGIVRATIGMLSVRLTYRRLVEWGSAIRSTFESVVHTHLYPRSQIDIVVHVLQQDGGTCVTAC